MASRLFYEPRSRYIANQSGSAKETVSPKIGENIEMLVCFICAGKQDRILIDVNWFIIKLPWINIKTEHDIEAILLYLLLIFLHLFIVYLFRQRNGKKKFLPAGSSWLFFISPDRRIANEQLFKVGFFNKVIILINYSFP